LLCSTNRDKPANLIQKSDFSLNDEHWTVIDDRRITYSDCGLPTAEKCQDEDLDL